MARQLFLFTFFYPFLLICNSFTLKEFVEIESNKLFLKDLIKEETNSNLSNIFIKEIDSFPVRIDSEEILRVLINNSKQNITLIGSYSIVYKKENDENILKGSDNYEQWSIKSEIENRLKEEMGKFLGENYKLVVTIQDKNVEDKILKIIQSVKNEQLKEIKNNFSVLIPKFEKGLSDIQKINKITIAYKNKKIEIPVTIELFQDIFISKEKIKRDEKLNVNKFEKINCDILKIKDFTSLMFNPDNFSKYKFKKDIEAGQFIRINDVVRIPDLVIGEEIKILIKNGDIEITLSGKSLSNCNYDEYVSVKTNYGKILRGYLTRINDEKVVYIN